MYACLPPVCHLTFTFSALTPSAPALTPSASALTPKFSTLAPVCPPSASALTPSAPALTPSAPALTPSAPELTPSALALTPLVLTRAHRLTQIYLASELTMHDMSFCGPRAMLREEMIRLREIEVETIRRIETCPRIPI